jgi:hypothetical protein
LETIWKRDGARSSDDFSSVSRDLSDGHPPPTDTPHPSN